jgi:hypothetical protein
MAMRRGYGGSSARMLPMPVADRRGLIVAKRLPISNFD